EVIKAELERSGILFRQFQGPTTSFIFLGWLIDTESMTVVITPDRKSLMVNLLEEWGEKSSFTSKELSSLRGLLIFLGQVINGLRSTTALLIKLRTMLNSKSTRSVLNNPRIRTSLEHVAYVLNRWGG